MHGAHEDSETAPPIRLLAEKYRLIRELGRGAMGAVWQAEHLTLHSPVAIKLLDPEIAADAQALQRFLHEARAAAALRSPHVVQILDHGVFEDTPYIVMEQLEGESLAARLEARSQLSPRDTARIVTHIARALARAHAAGIVHRDLKPANVFLVNNDDEELAKLFDFGIAKSLHDAKLASRDRTLPGVPVGTPYYMSPEQVEGATTVDHRADIWALGVIAFECLLGCRPFESSSVTGLLLSIRDDPLPTPSLLGLVPAGFDAWFAHTCARKPSDRYQSAKQAANDLRRLCERASPPRSRSGADQTLLSLSASRPGLLREARAPRHGWRRVTGAALALGFSGSGLLLASFALGPTEKAPTDAPTTSHAALVVSVSGAVSGTGATPASPPAPEKARFIASRPEVIPIPDAPEVDVAPPTQSPHVDLVPRAPPPSAQPKAPPQKRAVSPRAAAPLPTSAPNPPLRAPNTRPSASPRTLVDLGI